MEVARAGNTASVARILSFAVKDPSRSSDGRRGRREWPGCSRWRRVSAPRSPAQRAEERSGFLSRARISWTWESRSSPSGTTD